MAENKDAAPPAKGKGEDESFDDHIGKAFSPSNSHFHLIYLFVYRKKAKAFN
jgi:hypothetical protein